MGKYLGFRKVVCSYSRVTLSRRAKTLRALPLALLCKLRKESNCEQAASSRDEMHSQKEYLNSGIEELWVKGQNFKLGHQGRTAL
jgi:hypothetical protein